jgi:hypothetical protein
MIAEPDLAAWTEEILIALKSLKTRGGLKVWLGPDDEIQLLASAITAVNNTRADIGLFQSVTLKGLAPDV